MKKDSSPKSFHFLSICTFLIMSSQSFSQVGINTTAPRTTLEVAGDTYIEGSINVKEIDYIQDVTVYDGLNPASPDFSSGTF